MAQVLIHPSQLPFVVPIVGNQSGKLTIANPTNIRMTFNVECHSRSLKANPRRGFIEPKSSSKVMINIKEQATFPDSLVVVKTAVVPYGVPDSIEFFWSTTGPFATTLRAQVHLYDVVVCGVPTVNEQEKLWIKAMSIAAKEDTSPKVNEKETTSVSFGACTEKALSLAHELQANMTAIVVDNQAVTDEDLTEMRQAIELIRKVNERRGATALVAYLETMPLAKPLALPNDPPKIAPLSPPTPGVDANADPSPTPAPRERRRLSSKVSKSSSRAKQSSGKGSGRQKHSSSSRRAGKNDIDDDGKPDKKCAVM